jgi:Protein of unknown function (DUF3105)
MAQRKSSASTRSRRAAQATARSRGSSPATVDAVEARESAKTTLTTADESTADAATAGAATAGSATAGSATADSATADSAAADAPPARAETKAAGKSPSARTRSDARGTKAGDAAVARDAQTRSAKRPKGAQPLKPATRPQPAKSAPGRRPPGNRPGKSIVNQRQTPWGLIAAAVAVVLFAGGVIAYAVTRSSGSGSSSDLKPATATAAEIAKIPGITHKTITSRNHVTGVVKYPDSPPFGGDHNQYWAQCTGTVYDHQLANENAVHTLEHGAIWITYRPGLDQASISTLTNKVLGKNYMLLTPYAGLKTPISLQAWGYQLFVNSANDPRIDQFITDLRLNPNVIPEYGASCDDPQFVASKSTPGHPFDG